MKREAWLDGKIEGFSAIKMPAAHALVQAKYELENVLNLSNEDMFKRPNDMSSAAFQLRHIAGSIDRLLTYTRGEDLTRTQFDVLKDETAGISDLNFEELREKAVESIDTAIEFLKNVSDDELFEKRFVGREKLSTNVFGLLYHIAEHTARHVGQLITTAKIAAENNIKPISEIQDWYESNCDGNWEHEYGIKIDTLDNPGWTVEIDLTGTTLENKLFQEFKENRSESNWIFCKTENSKFYGYADPEKLEMILQTFLNWSKT